VRGAGKGKGVWEMASQQSHSFEVVGTCVYTTDVVWSTLYALVQPFNTTLICLATPFEPFNATKASQVNRRFSDTFYLLSCRCLRRAVRDQSRGRDVDSEDRAGPHEQSVEEVADPHLKAEQDATTRAARVQSGASVRSAVGRTPHRDASLIMPARTRLQGAVRCASWRERSGVRREESAAQRARVGLVEHLKKRMSAHGKERDRTGIRWSARNLVVTRPSSGRFGATPSNRRTESERWWW
jgi:hypothetical protein